MNEFGQDDSGRTPRLRRCGSRCFTRHGSLRSPSTYSVMKIIFHMSYNKVNRFRNHDGNSIRSDERTLYITDRQPKAVWPIYDTHHCTHCPDTRQQVPAPVPVDQLTIRVDTYVQISLIYLTTKSLSTVLLMSACSVTLLILLLTERLRPQPITNNKLHHFFSTGQLSSAASSSAEALNRNREK